MRSERRIGPSERKISAGNKAEKQVEAQDEERAMLSFFLQDDSLDANAALELVSTINEKPPLSSVEGTKRFVESFGVAFDSLPEAEQSKYTILYYSAEKARRDSSRSELSSRLERELKKEIFNKALESMDVLINAFLESEDTEVLEKRLYNVMDRIENLASHASPEHDENEEMWKLLYDKFVSVMSVRMKAKESGENIDDIFSRVTDRYRDFIDNEIIIRAFDYLTERGVRVSYEDITRRTFNRTPEEVERLKERNRKAVAEYIQDHREDPPTADTLEELYRLNNKDIVPGKLAGLRKKEEETTFYKRVGIIGGEDVKEEVDDVTTRATRTMFKPMSDTGYAMAVAKLHNDLLEIHPFSDRNGSTALLFAEFMMSKRGYKPSEKREGKYYGNVRKIFRNNPIAIALIAQAQWKIANISGHYAGRSTEVGTVEGLPKKQYYQKFVKRHLAYTKWLEDFVREEYKQEIAEEAGKKDKKKKKAA